MTRNELKIVSENFLIALESLDIEKLNDFWTEESKISLPYSTGMFPTDFIGLEAVKKQVNSLPAGIDSLNFLNKEIIIDDERNVVIVLMKGKHHLKGNNLYETDYVHKYEFNEAGKLIHWVEYFNPYDAGKSFGLLDKITK